MSGIVSTADRTAGGALEWGRGILGTTDEARLEVEILLGAAAGITREGLYAYPERTISGCVLAQFEAAVRERAERGCPVAYLTGKKEFAGLDLAMERGVFIPRPETEGLVEHVVEWWRSTKRDAGSGIIAEPCCGSGAVGIAIAHLLGARVICADVCEAAVALAKSNARRCYVEHLVRVRKGECLAFLEEADAPIAAVVANPPYVTGRDMAGLSRDILDFEPHAALEGGPDGLRIIRRLVASAAGVLMPGGLLALEIGADQEEPVRAILKSAAWECPRVERDLSRKPRYLLARRAGPA